MTPEQRLQQLGISLPSAPDPKGLYRPLVIVGNLAFTSGHLPMRADGSVATGRVGWELDENAGAEAARLAGLGILATVRQHLKSLDRVRRVVTLLGLVQCTPDFTRQPTVLNGASQLLADVFGPDSGIGARSAVGANALPLGAAVELEAIFEITVEQ